MKTYKTIKKGLNEIFIMQDLSPRIENLSPKIHFHRKCGVSKVMEQEEYQQRKELRVAFNDIAARPSTQQGKNSRNGSKTILSS